MAKPSLSKKQQKKIAQSRVEGLLTQARVSFSSNSKRAHRYTALARKIAMKVRLTLPTKHKRAFCKFCYKFLMPGSNARVRIQGHKIVISCLECKKFTRIPLRKKIISDKSKKS